MTIINFKTFINEAKRLSGSLMMKDRKTMRKKLRENILVFKFQKRDGTIRRAVGTLYPDLLPPIKGTGGPKPVYQMVYFDLEKLAWRSFRSFKFIKILKETPITDSIVDEYLKKIEDEKIRKEEEKKHKITKKEKEKREKERELEREEEEKERNEGREEEREEERKGGRALLASAVHVARAPYMNVTQDVAVGLSCILCTPTLDYPEYHAHLRPICSIFYENSK